MPVFVQLAATVPALFTVSVLVLAAFAAGLIYPAVWSRDPERRADTRAVLRLLLARDRLARASARPRDDSDEGEAGEGGADYEVRG